MQFKSSLLLFLVLSLMTACGGGDDAIDEVRKRPNAFAGNNPSENGFSSGSTGDSGNTSGLEDNEVRVTLEVPAGLVRESEGEPTRRNLHIVQADRVRAFHSNRSLQDLGKASASIRTDDNGSTIIRFPGGQPLAPDVIIEAQYGNATLQAPAADADRHIRVNPFSEYLVRQLQNYSPTEFQSLLNCVNEVDQSLCLNKYVWSTLADQVHDFEIDIPGGASVDAAVSYLGERGDFASYVAAMADYALLQEKASGEISASSADYNSVFMGLELGHTFAESPYSGAGQWGVRLGREQATGTEDAPAYLYPGLTLASFDIFNIQVASLGTQIPYSRTTLAQTDSNDFFSRDSDDWLLNTHSSAPGPATRSALTEDAVTVDRHTRLLAGRALYQTITGRNTDTPIGWTRNPYFMDAYTGAAESASSAPDRALTGYFSAGKAIALEPNGDDLRRRDDLEAHYLSVMELNLLRQKGFDAEVLNGHTYNTVFFSTRFSDSSTPVQAEAGTGTWQISAGSEGSSVAVDETFTTLSRDSSGAVGGLSTGTGTAPRVLTPRMSLLSSGEESNGWLNLDKNTPAEPFNRPDLGVGASTPDGSLLAFNLANQINGNGLLIAGKAAVSAKAPTSGRYRVQGFIMGMELGANRLMHLDNGVLEFSETGVDLDTKVLTVAHDVASSRVSTPVSEPFSYDFHNTDSGTVSDGQVSFSSGSASLKGFVTEDRKQLFLVYEDNPGTGEKRLGLLMATLLH
ncbi:hypothetical protein [Marinobacter piscensis]|uniref:hypothetical protein n=1 Tax=Marinobacter piscensis TaxID=1562308 RepID=UPI0011AA2104|nr:hypothetical protein [Marinobacter piscensis]